MKVLIIGANGFIGTHLTQTLVQLGIEVVALVREEHPEINVKSFKGDVTLPETLSQAMKGVTHVFHLAAIPVNRECEKNKALAHAVNVNGTRNVLEACEEQGVEWFFFPSTIYVYGKEPRLPVRETQELKPFNTYTQTKYVGEQLCEDYRKHFPITIFRLSNSYGPGQKGRVIPDLITKALINKEITIIGDGTEERDLIHIKDVISAMITAMRLKHNSALNIGSGVPTSINELAKLISEELGGVKIIHERAREQTFPKSVYADVTLAKQELGWEPKITLKQGIKELIQQKRKELNIN